MLGASHLSGQFTYSVVCHLNSQLHVHCVVVVSGVSMSMYLIFAVEPQAGPPPRPTSPGIPVSIYAHKYTL